MMGSLVESFACKEWQATTGSADKEKLWRCRDLESLGDFVGVKPCAVQLVVFVDVGVEPVAEEAERLAGEGQAILLVAAKQFFNLRQQLLVLDAVLREFRVVRCCKDPFFR